MPVILPWQPIETCDAVLRHLAAGGVALLPTESTYELVGSALHAEAVAELAKQAGSAAVIVSQHGRLRDWLPHLRGAAARLLRKLGPGPVVLLADAGYRSGLWSRLPQAAKPLVARDNRLAVRRPAHPLWIELARCDLPLLSVATELTELSAEAVESLGVTFAIDAGPTALGKKPSVVQAENRRCHLVVEGGLSRDVLADLTCCRILFVCTGNTCRSPMAAALCARLLADHLGCVPAELPQHGFSVRSAGLAAMPGSPASPDAVEVAVEFGADLGAHRSAMVTLESLAFADHIFAMTFGHWHTIANIPIAQMPAPRLLSPDDEDVPDPIGGERSDYRICAEQILACLRRRLPELLES